MDNPSTENQEKLKDLILNFQAGLKELNAFGFACFVEKGSPYMGSIKEGIKMDRDKLKAMDADYVQSYGVGTSIVMGELLDMLITYIIALDVMFSSKDGSHKELFKQLLPEITSDAKSTVLKLDEFQKSLPEGADMCSPETKNKLRQIINAVEGNYYGS